MYLQSLFVSKLTAKLQKMKSLSHEPVLLKEILESLPDSKNGQFLDVTAGGGGHFFSIIENRKSWKGECWDRDPLAKLRIHERAEKLRIGDQVKFLEKNFSETPIEKNNYDFILADLGVSSFQLDDPKRGMSLFSEMPPDFRMNPSSGDDFKTWLKKKSTKEIEEILSDFGEEPRAKKLAAKIKSWGDEVFESAKILAQKIAEDLQYKSDSKIHPATRSFQAFRIAINDELSEIRSLLKWAPKALRPGGRLAIISFHSLEDRIVKNAFKNLAEGADFDILSKRPIVASDEELASNSRSRSAKLRVIERRGFET